jgi:hypothetical protein
MCDCCKDRDAWYICVGCQKEYCFDCYNYEGVLYSHSINFSGTGDIYVCRECDREPPESIKALLSAYKEVRKLRKEGEESYEEYQRRSKVAELHAEMELSKYKITKEESK